MIAHEFQDLEHCIVYRFSPEIPQLFSGGTRSHLVPSRQPKQPNLPLTHINGALSTEAQAQLGGGENTFLEAALDHEGIYRSALW